MQQLPVNSLLHGGTYRIIRFIGSGGFGCTYEGEHVMLRKRVAIKEFFVKDFCNREGNTGQITIGTVSKKTLVNKLRQKFIDEARSLCQLQYPGIVGVSDVFDDNGTSYFVMDFIEGCSIADIIKREGPLNEERALRYIRKVIKALQHVHNNNRLHLDIKPANLMLDAHDNPVLIDFGASKQYDEEGGENTSTLVGKTPGFAPPEQMSNSVVKFTPATDIYALGATLYKMLTGKTPVDAHLRMSGDEIKPLPDSVSANTRNAVMAAMQLRKMDRPQSLSEFLSILDSTPAQTQTEPVEEETLPFNSSTNDNEDDETVIVGVSTPTENNSFDTSSQQTESPDEASSQPANVDYYYDDEPESSGFKKWIIPVVLACVLGVVAFLIFKPWSSTVDSEPSEDINYVTDFQWESAIGPTLYTGNLSAEGLPNGYGTAKIVGGDLNGAVYEGDFENGDMTGDATYTLPNGDVFKGTFKDNKYDNGRYTFKETGNYFEGAFKNDAPDTNNGHIYDKLGNLIQ